MQEMTFNVSVTDSRSGSLLSDFQFNDILVELLVFLQNGGLFNIFLSPKCECDSFTKRSLVVKGAHLFSFTVQWPLFKLTFEKSLQRQNDKKLKYLWCHDRCTFRDWIISSTG